MLYPQMCLALEGFLKRDSEILDEIHRDYT